MVSSFSYAWVLVLVSACEKSSGNYDPYDCKPKGNGLVALYMRDNQNDHIRDWQNTYLVNGSIDPAKAGLISDSRVRAQMGCFKWIHSYGNEVQESTMSLCIYQVGPVSKIGSDYL